MKKIYYCLMLFVCSKVERTLDALLYSNKLNHLKSSKFKVFLFKTINSCRCYLMWNGSSYYYNSLTLFTNYDDDKQLTDTENSKEVLDNYTNYLISNASNILKNQKECKLKGAVKSVKDSVVDAMDDSRLRFK